MIFWSFFQIVLVLGALGYGAYYLMKKTKQNEFNRVGEKGKIQILDGMSLSHQTSSYLLQVDGQQLFVVVGQNGIETTILKEKGFQQLLKDGLEEDNEYEDE